MIDLADWLTAHGSSAIEVIGFLTGVLNVFLVTRENLWSWPLGVVNASMYIVVFARAGLYSDTGLQAVYFVLSLYGWYHWLRGGPRRAPVVVTHTPRRSAGLLFVIALIAWWIVFSITSRIPGSRLALLDAALAVGSLAAQWMMTRKFAQTWLVWIVIDAVYVGVFIARDLRLTAVLYAIFLLLAVYGHFEWKRSLVRTSRASS